MSRFSDGRHFLKQPMLKSNVSLNQLPLILSLMVAGGILGKFAAALR